MENDLFFQNRPSIIVLLFLKANLSIFAWGLIFVDENYLNETNFFWFKQNIVGPNKYLVESKKFLPSIKPFISLTIYHWINFFVLKKNWFESNKYLFHLKYFINCNLKWFPWINFLVFQSPRTISIISRYN